MENKHVNHTALDMKVEGVRPGDRSRRRWADCDNEDMKEKNLESTDARDRRKWRKEVMNVDPDDSSEKGDNEKDGRS